MNPASSILNIRWSNVNLMGAALAGFVGLAALTRAATDEPPAAAAPNEVQTTSQARTRDALVFRNGDLLYGALESISPGGGIRWRHTDVEEVIAFNPESVSEVHFPLRREQSRISANSCRFVLNNGDQLEGQVQVLDQDKVQLQTWYAGEITLPRDTVRLVVPVPPEGATVFQGPAGMPGWTIGKVVSPTGDAGEWRYSNGAFYATNAASIARDVHLPDVARIEFDLAWKGLFQLAVALYTDYYQPINLQNKDTEPEFGGFYSLQINSFSANLLPVKKNDPLRFLGQVSVPAFNQKNAAHVEIRASKPKRSVSLFVDGQLVKQWIENDEFVGQGTGVRFVHQGQGKVKMSHFRVSEWDGQFEEKPSAVPDPKHDLAKLRNGDKVTGTLESIHDGRISFASSSTKLDIPLERVKQIELAGQHADTPPPQLNARAFFNQGGAVSFQLEKWEAGKVIGSSPNFGRLSFDAQAFAKVELNLKAAAH
jgi:hypothetical protein